MKWEEAVKFEQEIKGAVVNSAIKIGVNKLVAIELVDRYVEISPDEPIILGMMILGEASSYSIKLGNICVNQKGMLMKVAIELGLSLEFPDNRLNGIKLCLLTLLTIMKSCEIEITENESYVVAYLHYHHMYEKGIEEHSFYKTFSNWYSKRTGETISKERVKFAIKKLLKIKSIVIKDGEIRLQECVWYYKKL